MYMSSPIAFEKIAEEMNRFGGSEQVRENRIRIITTPDRIREAILTAQESLSCDHPVTISAADIGDKLELQYHLTGPHRFIISLVLRLPYERPDTPSIADLVPPAGIYERQIHDLLGIVFSGHPGLKRIILSESWPEGEYPLRKDWKPRADACSAPNRSGG